MDCDTHCGDVAMMLNLPTEPAITDTIAMAGSLDRSSVIEQTAEHPSGIRVLPGPAAPEAWESVKPEDVERLVGVVAEVFDFVVIDTPDIFDRIVEQCVRSATLVLLVTSFDLSSIADTKVALRVLCRWDCPPEKVRVTVNSIRKRSGLKEGHVSQALNWPVFCSIPYEKRVAEAAQLGESLLQRAPGASFSRTIRELAGAISGAGSGEARRERQGGLLRLLTRGSETAVTG